MWEYFFFPRRTEPKKYELLSNQKLHRVIAPVIESRLCPLGFVRQKDLTWLRSKDAPIRQVFTFVKWKGGVFAPRWGLSFDFVPHVVANATIKWHRTEKSAGIDFVVDARERECNISYIYGPQEVSGRIERVMQRVMPSATKLWDSTRCVSQIPAAFEWRKEGKHSDFLSLLSASHCLRFFPRAQWAAHRGKNRAG
ncbi:hypothetical protein ABK905_17050 [Acerihabitans sp. KWT182]|uniref:Uncharacterized protein n=1 Tax=Acerihabitans sp. KWT182 TaxID=3157919 RepID=A0AAU7Q5I1_9GAMM